MSIAEDRGVGGELREDCVQAVADENSGFFFSSVDVAIAVRDDSGRENLHRTLRGGAHAGWVRVGLYHTDRVRWVGTVDSADFQAIGIRVLELVLAVFGIWKVGSRFDGCLIQLMARFCGELLQVGDVAGVI